MCFIWPKMTAYPTPHHATMTDAQGESRGWTYFSLKLLCFLFPHFGQSFEDSNTVLMTILDSWLQGSRAKTYQWHFPPENYSHTPEWKNEANAIFVDVRRFTSCQTITVKVKMDIEILNDLAYENQSRVPIQGSIYEQEAAFPCRTQERLTDRSTAVESCTAYYMVSDLLYNSGSQTWNYSEWQSVLYSRPIEFPEWTSVLEIHCFRGRWANLKDQH